LGKPITGMLAYIVAGRELRPTSPYAKCLLQYYCSNVNKHGSFFKSAFNIQFETGLSERFIRKTNAKWKTGGLLSWVQGSNLTKRANTYTLDLEKLQKFVSQSIETHNAYTLKLRQQSAERSQKYRERRKSSRTCVP
jgi:hypothetical protein